MGGSFLQAIGGHLGKVAHVCRQRGMRLKAAIFKRLRNRASGDDLFELPSVTARVDQAGLIPLMHKGNFVREVFYYPSRLVSSYAPWRHKIDRVSFVKVSFTQTVIDDYEFKYCRFERCLFIGTTFRNCRFTNCDFISCNFFRSEFFECFVDPSQFDGCLPKAGYENIGVHLFQELLRNSRQQVQPDFADEAQYRFRKWQRYQLWAQMVNSGSFRTFFKSLPKHSILYAFDRLTGSGMRIGRLLTTCSIAVVAISVLNWSCATLFGLKHENVVITKFGDAFYTTVIVMTTLGFGDITPTESLGRIAVSCEALFGFMVFAFLTSTLYRKLSS